MGVLKNHSFSSDFEVIEYSAKAIAVFGDTKLIKEQLKELGGRFNPALIHNGQKCAGWIFSRKSTDKVCALLGVSVQPATAA